MSSWSFEGFSRALPGHGQDELRNLWKTNLVVKKQENYRNSNINEALREQLKEGVHPIQWWRANHPHTLRSSHVSHVFNLI